jgi:hypothetical protein
MKQGSRHATGNGNEIALALEHFDMRRPGHIREIHRLTVANASGNFVGCGDAWQRWQKFSRMHEYLFRKSLIW